MISKLSKKPSKYIYGSAANILKQKVKLPIPYDDIGFVVFLIIVV